MVLGGERVGWGGNKEGVVEGSGKGREGVGWDGGVGGVSRRRRRGRAGVQESDRSPILLFCHASSGFVLSVKMGN